MPTLRRVLPLKDDNPTRRPAVVTVALILVNVAVFVVLQQMQPGTDTVAAEVDTPTGPDAVAIEIPGALSFDLQYAAIPCEVTSREALTTDEVYATFVDGDGEACGADVGLGGHELFPDKREWVAVLFSMFLHDGWVHLGGNMLFLWIFGNNIEDRLGRVRYLLFYLAGGLVAAGAHVAVQPDATIPVIGASGAVAAVMGAYLVWFPNARVRTLVVLLIMDVRAKWLLTFWFFFQFFTSPDDGVAWMAHVGGFAFGALVALLVRASPRSRDLLWAPEHRAVDTWGA